VNSKLVVAALQPPRDPTTQRMCSVIASEPDHPLPTWLSFFAQTAAEDVAASLVRRGLLQPEGRGVLRSKVVYSATDATSHAWRSLRLVRVIRDRDVQTWGDLMLVALLVATGLGEEVLAHGTAEDRASLRAVAT